MQRCLSHYFNTPFLFLHVPFSFHSSIKTITHVHYLFWDFMSLAPGGLLNTQTPVTHKKEHSVIYHKNMVSLHLYGVIDRWRSFRSEMMIFCSISWSINTNIRNQIKLGGKHISNILVKTVNLIVKVACHSYLYPLFLLCFSKSHFLQS